LHGGPGEAITDCAYKATWSAPSIASAQATSALPPTAAPARPTGRLSHSSCIVGKHLVVFGGSTAMGTELRSVQLLVSTIVPQIGRALLSQLYHKWHRGDLSTNDGARAK
jgi:hypothetical protein